MPGPTPATMQILEGAIVVPSLQDERRQHGRHQLSVVR